MMRKVGLLLLFVVFSNSLFSQFNIGLQVSYLYGFNSSNPGHYGGGLRGEVNLNTKMAIQFGYNYFYKAEYETEVDVKAKSLLTQPQVFSQSASSLLTVNQFYAGIKKYIRGTQYTFKPESEAGIYLMGELGVMVGGMKIKTEDNLFDATKYDIPLRDNDLHAFTDLSLHGGIGFDKLVGSKYIYFNVLLGSNVIRVIDTGSPVDLPFFVTSNFGIRIPFGDDN